MPSAAPVINGSTTPFKVLVIGGSYAGLTAALILLDLCNGRSPRFVPTEAPVSTTQIPVEVTIVDERDGFYHLIGNPLALASKETVSKFWKKFGDIPAVKTAPGLRCVQGSVESIDCEAKTAKIANHGSTKTHEEKYDFLVVASGLRRVWPTVPRSKTEEDYRNDALNHIKLVENAEKGVVVIGGGAVGIEMAAEIKEHYPNVNVKLIHSRDRLLSAEDLPDDFAAAAATLLQEVGVELVLGQRVTSTREVLPTLHQLTLSDGTVLEASVVISAISRSTSTSSFLPDNATDKEGYINVSPNMNFLPEVPNYTHHYAAGDIVRWSGIKRAGAAMHMGQMAARNIHQRMLNELGLLKAGEEMKFTELVPIAPMMGLSVGHLGVCYGPEEGTKSGEDIRKLFFGDDLGFTICWNYMKLGEEFGI